MSTKEAATIKKIPTENIHFDFDKFMLVRGLAYKEDFSMETAIEWFSSLTETLDRYEEEGLYGLLDMYDPNGFCFYARVLEQDNTADKTRTYDGCREYLKDQIRHYTNFAYTMIRRLNKISAQNKAITGGYIYPPHDGTTYEKRYEFVQKFVSDLSKWLGEDVSFGSFEKVVYDSKSC